MRILFIADVYGSPGRQAVRELLPRLRAERAADAVVLNGENSAAGFGMTPEIAKSFLDQGADVVTGGNHLWAQRTIVEYICGEPRLIRALNFPPGTPGAASAFVQTASGAVLAVTYVLGRTYMEPLDDPFRALDAELARPEWQQATARLVEVHAEATSEKMGLGHFLDGRVSAVIGTHTHVQTADAKLLPGGTAYLTDAGMTGPHHSVIGLDIGIAHKRMRRQMPIRYEPATSDIWLNGAIVEVDDATGLALTIQAIQEPLLS